MKRLKLVYKKDPRRWIPTIMLGIFLVILTFYSIIDSFMSVWPGWAVILTACLVLIIDTLKQTQKLKNR
jgi:hypothetical protein